MGLGLGQIACNGACRFDAADCTQQPECGNGIQEPGEFCDDGNLQDCDGCSARCRMESCGNALLDCGEDCDDSGLDAGDGCGSTCLLEVCGNAHQDPGEDCDVGDLLPGDGCGPTCLRPSRWTSSRWPGPPALSPGLASRWGDSPHCRTNPPHLIRGRAADPDSAKGHLTGI